MDLPQQRSFAETFRELHHAPRILLLPNAWDAMSARVFAHSGFAALATTSAGVAWALGYRDGEEVPRNEMLGALRRIVRVAGVPVTADIESGFGSTLDELNDSITAVVETGVVGINLEDGVKGKVRPLEEAAERISIAREAANAAGVAIVINARTDLILRSIGDEATRLEATIDRCRAYLRAGADCVYPIGLKEPGAIERLVRAVQAPVNIMGSRGGLALAELQRLGVRRVSTATGPSLLAIETTRKVAQALRESGTFDALDASVTFAEAQQLFAP
jgi:2-methylisocitrate lyase-like PEP mutase family enzyme